MKLINNTKTKFTTSKGDFGIGKIMNFDEAEAATLLRYSGIKKVSDLETPETTEKNLGNKTIFKKK